MDNNGNDVEGIVLCNGLDVLTFPKQLFVSEGQRNVNLLCKVPGGQSIDFCIVKVPGVPAPFASSERLPTPVPGITFYGEGWSQGSCGVTLDRIIPEYDGIFECTVAINGQTHKGTIEIMIKVPPSPPVIELSSNIDARNGEFDYGKPLVARCISRNGWPGAELSWYLDDAPITQELGAAFSETVRRKTTVQQFFRKSVAVEDNRKRLICRATHDSYPSGYVETILPIKLRKSNNTKYESKQHELREIKPSPPQLVISSDIHTSNGSFKIGSSMVIQCISRDGTPPATFLWFLDDQLIYEGLSSPFVSRDDLGTSTVQQVLQRQVQESDNGKKIICKARHPSGSTETQLKITTFE
ncbi:fasciclin-3-like [Sabethes cyaneus]|uniref:fasciclin-3-like n=1 Tax=Sabethes cyaneus TaxID=53552 RepID=UPI00237E8DBC|nr:fasciclin-3-like [Sabethes cyaneus]